MLSQSERDKYKISLTCGIQNVTQMNIFTNQIQAHKLQKQTSLPNGNSEGGGAH